MNIIDKRLQDIDSLVFETDWEHEKPVVDVFYEHFKMINEVNVDRVGS